MSLADHYLNITEHNAAMWGLRQDEIDLGRNGNRANAAFWDWKQEHCMSGTATSNDDVAISQKLQEFAANFCALKKDAEVVRKFLNERTGVDVFVRVEGQLYNLAKNYSGSMDLPVCVRPATVIGE